MYIRQAGNPSYKMERGFRMSYDAEFSAKHDAAFVDIHTPEYSFDCIHLSVPFEFAHKIAEACAAFNAVMDSAVEIKQAAE